MMSDGTGDRSVDGCVPLNSSIVDRDVSICLVLMVREQCNGDLHSF